MSGGARKGSPASLSLLLLVAPLLAPAALASVPRGAAALSSRSLAADVDIFATTSLERSLARKAGSPFALDDVSLLRRSREGGFHVFAGDELGAAPFLPFELRYAKTRVRGLGLPDEARVGAERSLRLGAPWACDERSCGKASGSGEFRIFDAANSPLSASGFGWNRLFQGREYLPLLDAYDFRARTLWPELGRFGQEDPEGTVDSPNLYQALIGAWSLGTDPTGRFLIINSITNVVGPDQNADKPGRMMGTGRLALFSKSGELVFTTTTLNTGLRDLPLLGLDRSIRDANTPFGVWKIGETIDKTHTKKYGWGKIFMENMGGEAVAAGRSDFRIHGGGSFAPDPDAECQKITYTQGCPRTSNRDWSMLVAMIEGLRSSGDRTGFIVIGDRQYLQANLVGVTAEGDLADRFLPHAPIYRSLRRDLAANIHALSSNWIDALLLHGVSLNPAFDRWSTGLSIRPGDR